MLKNGRNSSSFTPISVIPQNCGQSLSVPLFHCNLLHLQSLLSLLFLKIVANHSVYLRSAAFRSILRQIGQCWKLFGIHLQSLLSPLFLKTVANYSAYLFFFQIFVGHMSFLWGYWYPCFGLLVTSALGFKTRVDSLACVLPRLCTTDSSDSPLVWHLPFPPIWVYTV